MVWKKNQASQPFFSTQRTLLRSWFIGFWDWDAEEDPSWGETFYHKKKSGLRICGTAAARDNSG